MSDHKASRSSCFSYWSRNAMNLVSHLHFAFAEKLLYSTFVQWFGDVSFPTDQRTSSQGRNASLSQGVHRRILSIYQKVYKKTQRNKDFLFFVAFTIIKLSSNCNILWSCRENHKQTKIFSKSREKSLLYPLVFFKKREKNSS